MSIVKHCDEAAMDEEDQLEDEASIIYSFLALCPRGGALGSATTARKRQQISKLVDLIKVWGDGLDDEEEGGELSSAIEELQQLVVGWAQKPPTKKVIMESLQGIVEKLGGDSRVASGKGSSAKGSNVGGGKAASGSLHHQSFYDAMMNRQNGKNDPNWQDYTGWHTKGKARGKGKKGKEELPRFDLKKVFPGLTLTTWQSTLNFLEKGEQPVGQICLCQDPGQVMHFMEVAAVGGVQTGLILVAAWSEGDPDIKEGKVKLLPYLGNIAMRHAVIVRLDGKDIGEVGGQPAKVSLTTSSKGVCMVNIRINIALDFQDLATKTLLIGAPHQALHLLGAKDLLNEAKTFKWQSGAHRMVTGYVSVPKVDSFMRLSGTFGIFLQRLASDGPAPEVQWLKWEEKQSHEEYVKMAQTKAKLHNSYLAYRRGGGDCIGYVVDGLLHKHRLWELWGVEADCGPATVCNILKEIK